MGLIKKIFGLEFDGKVIDVQLAKERSSMRKGARFKGGTENGFAFNKDHIPPTYKVTLERKGNRKDFLICTDNPPEMGSNQNYRVEKRGDGTLYY
ncbi:MAG: hypothetical protein WCT85_03465 [Parachlamydiales bacterium]|jgi:hypothetical protein